MTARKRQFLSIWVDALLGDENVVGMDLETFGAYMKVLFKSWKTTTPGVIADEPTIARLAEAQHVWQRVGPAIMACFKKSRGKFVQKRLLIEFHDAAKRTRSAIGSEAAEQLSFLGSEDVHQHDSEIALNNPQNQPSSDSSCDPPWSPSSPSPSSPRTLPSPTPPNPHTKTRIKIVGSVADGPVSEREDAAMANLVGVRRLLVDLSEGKDLDRKSFNAQEIQLMLVRAGIADRKRWFKFAGWLWAGGVHEMRWIKFFIADAIERKVTTEFAYYAPGSEARTTTEIRAREASADEDRRDNERHVRELFGK